MALNFPSSPTNGQQYANWVYDSTKGAWEAKPLEAMAATPSPTAPLTPQSGDMWYNTNDGGVYVYYNDGNTSQWVQIKSDATLSSTLGNRVTTLETYPSGLVPIIPTSVTLSAGTSSTSTTGLVTFSGTNVVQLNGVFSSAYNYYFVRFLQTSGSADGVLFLRMVANGTPESGSYYSYSGATHQWNDTTQYVSYSTQNVYMQMGNGSGYYKSNQVTVLNPYVAGNTIIENQSTINSSGTTTNNYVGKNGGRVSTNTQYDGIYFTLSGTPTMGGTVQVYGYR